MRENDRRLQKSMRRNEIKKKRPPGKIRSRRLFENGFLIRPGPVIMIISYAIYGTSFGLNLDSGLSTGLLEFQEGKVGC